MIFFFNKLLAISSLNQNKNCNLVKLIEPVIL